MGYTGLLTPPRLFVGVGSVGGRRAALLGPLRLACMHTLQAPSSQRTSSEWPPPPPMTPCATMHPGKRRAWRQLLPASLPGPPGGPEPPHTELLV